MTNAFLFTSIIIKENSQLIIDYVLHRSNILCKYLDEILPIISKFLYFYIVWILISYNLLTHEATKWIVFNNKNDCFSVTYISLVIYDIISVKLN